MPSIDAAAALHASRHAPGGPDEVLGLPLIGTGSPEGVVSASVGAVWTDTNVTFGAVEWTKFTGTGTTGWRVTKGDTGRVDVTSQVTVGAAAPIAGDVVHVQRTQAGLTLWIVLAPRSSPSSSITVTLPAWALPAEHRSASGGVGGTPNLLVYAGGGVASIVVYSVPASVITRVTGLSLNPAPTATPWRTA